MLKAVPDIRLLVHLVLINLAGIPISAIGSNPGATHYTIDDGLNTNFVYCTFQDSRGFVWFGTEKGVCRYDGYQFEKFTEEDGLTYNEVLYIHEDSEGRVWFLTYNGVPCYFLNDSIYGPENDTLLSKVSFNRYVKYLQQDDQGRIWINAKYNTIYRIDYDNEKVDTINIEWITPVNNTVHGTWQSKNGDVWLITAGWYLNLNTNEKTIVDFTFTSHSRMVALPGKEGVLINYKEGIVYTDGKHFHLLNNSENLAGDNIIFLGFDRKEHLLVGTMNGAYIAVLDDNEINLKDHLFKGETITSIIQDTEESYWFSTMKNGVYFVPSLSITGFTTNNNLYSNIIYSLYYDSDVHLLYVGLDDFKVELFDGTGFNTIALNNSRKEHSRIKQIMKLHDQRLLFMSDNNLCFYSKEKLTTLSEFYVKSVLPINDDYFLSGSANLMFKIPYKFTLTDTVYQPNQFNHLVFCQSFGAYTLYPHYDSAYVLISNRDGVFQMRKDLDPFHRDSATRIFDKFASDIAITSDSVIWLSTTGAGLFGHYNDTMVHFTKNSGLNSVFCNTMLADGPTLWVGTGAGVYKVERNRNSFVISGLDMNDGLLSNEVNAIEKQNDTLWIGTTKGLNMIVESNQLYGHYNVPFYFEQVSIKNENLDLEAPNRFKYWQNDLHLEYRAIAFRHHSDITYRYRLLSNKSDTTWQNTRQTQLDFPALKPGKYHFQIMAMVNDLPIDSSSRSFHFTIKPPFFKTIWFFLLIAGLVLLSLIVAFRIRLLVYNKVVLQNLVDDLRHSMSGSTVKPFFVKVNGIKMRIDLESVLWINGAGDYIEINMENEKYLVDEKLKTINERLPKADFIRVHKSYIIRIDKISEFISSKAIRINDTSIPISRTYNEAFKKVKESLELDL